MCWCGTCVRVTSEVTRQSTADTDAVVGAQERIHKKSTVVRSGDVLLPAVRTSCCLSALRARLYYGGLSKKAAEEWFRKLCPEVLIFLDITSGLIACLCDLHASRPHWAFKYRGLKSACNLDTFVHPPQNLHTRGA